jgi:hypothetical protein
MAIAAMSSAAWLATGCVQNPVAPSLSIASHSPAPGRQLASGGSQLKIALEDRAERLRFTDIDKPERMQYTGLEKAERMKFADPAEHAEQCASTSRGTWHAISADRTPPWSHPELGQGGSVLSAATSVQLHRPQRDRRGPRRGAKYRPAHTLAPCVAAIPRRDVAAACAPRQRRTSRRSPAYTRSATDDGAPRVTTAAPPRKDSGTPRGSAPALSGLARR